MSTPWRLLNRATGDTLVEHLQVADKIWKRLLGLQFRRQLAPSSGMLLAPCSSIHTFWMRFSLDVVFVDQQGCVLGTRTAVRPWRTVFSVRGTWAILELPAHSPVLPVGTRLGLTSALQSSSALSPRLRFLYVP